MLTFSSYNQPYSRLDVVNAYKSLQNEKKALEVAVGTLSNENASQAAPSTSEASGSESEVFLRSIPSSSTFISGTISSRSSETSDYNTYCWK